jgi:xanthine dehydrogenase accessory factor
MQDIQGQIDNWLEAGQRVGLATVVSTWGSSPRQVGAKLALLADLSMVGSVSGGCVESAVLGEGADSLKDGKPRLLNFGVADEAAWDVGLACGGKITVYVEPLDTEWWRVATAQLALDQAFATVTILRGAGAGCKLLLDESGLQYHSPGLPPVLIDLLTAHGQAGLRERGSHQASGDIFDVFVDVYRPRPRLIIVGGAHVAVALAQMARLLGFRVALVDPRMAFATASRFPQAEVISHEYPDLALPKIGMTSETYIAILTHDPKIDDPALQVALPSPVPYVGILSSKRTHAARLERLTAAGVPPEQLQRIRTPIGLKIGAQTPEEIALCILAEIVMVRRNLNESAIQPMP